MTPPRDGQREIEVPKMFCKTCGTEMLSVVKIESYDYINGDPYYRAFYRCPNKKLFSFGVHQNMSRFLYKGETIK